jgi:preprotein translocase subunit SecD
MFEVGVVAQQSDAGARVFETAQGGSVAVRSPALVSARDVVGAEVSSAEGQTGLSVRVDAQAAERVRGFTASHVGARLAFIVDGRAQSVVKILDPITRDGVWISPMAPDTAGRLASGFNDCARDTHR